jgi:hypothetical protein
MENVQNEITGTDRMRSFLVLAATIGVIVFNWIAATGRLSGQDTGAISDAYPTLVTPAGYAFSIWSVIYLGMIAFSIYQLLPANVVRFRSIRSLYIFTCALNCAWLYFWDGQQILICFFIIVALLIALLFINLQVQDPESLAEAWIVKAPFGIYFGWVTAASAVNFAILLKFLNVELSYSAETAIAVVLMLAVAFAAIVVRIKLTNYFYPLAVAWALTAIAVKQSGKTAIVVAAAIGVVACLIASATFVMSLRSSEDREAS